MQKAMGRGPPPAGWVKILELGQNNEGNTYKVLNDENSHFTLLVLHMSNLHVILTLHS